MKNKINHINHLKLHRSKQKSYILMGLCVLISYSLSIFIKLILKIDENYIHFDLSVLLTHIILYFLITLIAKFEFKQTLSDASINALFFVPILSIGLAFGVLLFPENFMYFKFTTVVCGSINLMIFVMMLIQKRFLTN